MAKTNLDTLVERHDEQAKAFVRKQLQNARFAVNPNDSFWLYHLPQVEKQLGRSKRVFQKLTALCNL